MMPISCTARNGSTRSLSNSAAVIGVLVVYNLAAAHFEYGPLALALRYGGLFLLNEIDLVTPEVVAGLNGILDGSPLCIAENGGELVRPHPLFRFAATANSNGGGDKTGLYQGTQRQNAAFLDRCTLCELGSPDAARKPRCCNAVSRPCQGH